MNKIIITNIKIANFRSIINLELKIKDKENFISLCGANNVGKTNILNALALFFDRIEYFPEKDCPYHKFYGTQGGSYQPKITITFKNLLNTYQITKDWNLTKTIKKEQNIVYKISGKKNGNKIMESDIYTFLKKINFFYLTAINISFPDTIKYIMNSDIIDLETSGTRLSGKKGEMKETIEQILQDLQSLLDNLGSSISPLLEKYKEGWGLAFDLPKEVNTFRDLMIAEVDFYIKDKSNSKAIDAKGSGLQRLCHILMHFRIIEKLNSKKESVILLIDEPDVYLHSGLQKKLLADIINYSEKNQIFITTHSPIFIDTIKLANVFLLEQKVEEDKEFERGKRKTIENKKYNIVSTELVNFNDTNGITKLKKYLGIEDNDNLLFDKYNIIVEGEADKIYLIKLMEHFKIEVPNIISCDGADNIIKYLEFYDGIADQKTKNQFIVIIDNDEKGRTIFKNIKEDMYKKIFVKKRFIISYSGYDAKLDKNGNSNANIEIEDFIKPEIICHLVNNILKKDYTIFKKNDIQTIVKNIKKPAFQNAGILALLENKKNEFNPEVGQNIQINGFGTKKGLAQLFGKLDKEIITLIGNKEDLENKHIIDFLNEISGKTLF